MSTRGNVIAILVFVVFLIIAAVGGLFFFKSYYSQNNAINETSEDTERDSNLQTELQSYVNVNGFMFNYPDKFRLYLRSSSTYSGDVIEEADSLMIKEDRSVYSLNDPSMIVVLHDQNKDSNKLKLLSEDCTSYEQEQYFTSLDEFASLVYSEVFDINCHGNQKINKELSKTTFSGNDAYSFEIYSPQVLRHTTGSIKHPPANILYIMAKADEKYLLMAYDTSVDGFKVIAESFSFY